MNTILDATNIDLSVFSYTAPKPNPSGGKVVNLLNKHNKESLTMQTPLIMTWGAQEGKDQQGQLTGKWTASLQFPNKDYPNEDCDKFLENMRRIESQIKQDAIANSKEWFGKTITSLDVMEEKFNVMLRRSKIKGSEEYDETKAPTLTAKLPNWAKSGWQTEVYDEDGEPLFIKGQQDSSPLDFLSGRKYIICLLQSGGLWFVNGKLSITWNMKQVVVQKPKTSSITEGICFLKPKQNDIDKLKVQEEDKDTVESLTIVDDSDEEEEEDNSSRCGNEVVEEEEVIEEVVEEVVPKKRQQKKKV